MRRLLIVTFLFASSIAAQQRYIHRELNFSVATPAQDWQWQQVNRDHLAGCDGILVVTSPRGERFSVTVSPTGRYLLDEQTVTDILDGARRDGMQSGYKVADFSHIRSTSPVFPSYTYSYTRVGKDGKTSYVDGYIAAANRIYTIQYSSSERTSLDDFKRFVSSFQIADKFEAQRSVGGPAVSPWGGLPGTMQNALGQALAPNSLEPARW
jgi:hypothetical protein